MKLYTVNDTETTKMVRCSIYQKEVQSTAQLQARDHVTLILGYESYSSLKTLL